MDEFESFYVIFDRVKELMYGGSHARKMKTVLDLLLVKQTGGVESFIKEIVKLRDRFAQQGMPINDMWASCILISGISNEELRDRLQMTVLTAKDEAEVTFEALARTCAKVEESTKDFAALEKARGGGKKVNGITNGEALSAAAKKEANTAPRPPRNEVTKAENGDQWKPGFCRDCFKDQRLYFPWRSHGYKCSHLLEPLILFNWLYPSV